LTPIDGDIFGFVALALTGATALLMLLRYKLLSLTKNINGLRAIHVAVATGAGLFLLIHAVYFINIPLSTGVLLGYVSVFVCIAVWLTGMAFLERLRDSLFFHGTISILLVMLLLLHAALSSNGSLAWSELTILSTIVLATVNATYHIRKVFGRG
jgi:hypothetical protein